MENELNNRLFSFAVRCLLFIRKLSDSVEYKVVKYQLAKSVTSAGANYEESQAESSRADFSNKVKISLREMRESNYWLRIIGAIDTGNTDNKELQWMVKESEELKNILGSIVQKTRD